MKKIAICGATLALLVGLAGCWHDMAAKSASSHSQSTTSVKSKKVTATFKDNVIKTQALKVKITQSKVIPVGDEGNENGTKPVLAIWFSATNLSNNKVTAKSAWTALFAAYQKQASKQPLKLGDTPDATLKDHNFNIPKGDTMKGAVAYELVDEEASVTLKAVAAQTVGSKVFDVKAVLAAATSSSAAAEVESAAAASSSQAAADSESAAAASAASDSASDVNAQSSSSDAATADGTADGTTAATDGNSVNTDQQSTTGADTTGSY
jgi:hypothetical protein